MAVEHVLGKIREGKKLSTEDVLVLYLGTIVSDLKEIRTDIARLDSRIDETNKRIDQTNQRIDDIVKTLSARIDETNKRIDELARSLSVRIDETNKKDRCRPSHPPRDPEAVDRTRQVTPTVIAKHRNTEGLR
jgi:uncharacterized coiled-coil DUF342 family protein